MYSSRSCSPFIAIALSPFVSHQTAQRPKVQVQVLVLQPERLLQLFHPLLEQHEGLAQPLHLIRRETAALDPAERLALQQLPQQLDQRQDELRKALLELVAIGVDPATQGSVQPIQLIAEELQVGMASQALVSRGGVVIRRRPHALSSELKL